MHILAYIFTYTYVHVWLYIIATDINIHLYAKPTEASNEPPHNSSYHNNAYKSNIENHIRSFVLLIYMHYLHLLVVGHTFIYTRVCMCEKCILLMASTQKTLVVRVTTVLQLRNGLNVNAHAYYITCTHVCTACKNKLGMFLMWL